MVYTEQELRHRVDGLSPWHYCHQFPHGVVTGDSMSGYNEKLELMTAAGAWPEPGVSIRLSQWRLR